MSLSLLETQFTLTEVGENLQGSLPVLTSDDVNWRIHFRSMLCLLLCEQFNPHNIKFPYGKRSVLRKGRLWFKKAIRKTLNLEYKSLHITPKPRTKTTWLISLKMGKSVIALCHSHLLLGKPPFWFREANIIRGSKETLPFGPKVWTGSKQAEFSLLCTIL